MISGLVTIAIPAYKSTYLREAIDSALAQDYKNIELVIVNDKSPYDIDSIVQSYNDVRIRYYVNEKNLGKKSIVHNWNRCLDYACGEFFVLLADDDALMPNFVSELLRLAEKYPQCNVFHGRRCIKNEETGEINNDAAWPEYETSEQFFNEKLDSNRPHTITEFLYRTEYIKKIKYVIFPLGWCSDDASVTAFVKKGGIASSSDVVAMFRVSNIHISNPACFHYIKAKVRIMYMGELLTKANDEITQRKIIGLLEYLILSILKKCSYVDRMRILSITPCYVFNLKQKIYLLLSKRI